MATSINANDCHGEKQRIDKWLWAARFYKTRSLAAAAIEGGKVHHGDQRIKPAREIRVGDQLDIVVGDMRWTVTVRGLSAQRGPAPVARLLYEETAESALRRQQQAEQHKLAPSPAAQIKGRPTKQDGRRLRRFLDR